MIVPAAHAPTCGVCGPTKLAAVRNRNRTDGVLDGAL